MLKITLQNKKKDKEINITEYDEIRIINDNKDIIFIHFNDNSISYFNNDNKKEDYKKNIYIADIFDHFKTYYEKKDE